MGEGCKTVPVLRFKLRSLRGNVLSKEKTLEILHTKKQILWTLCKILEETVAKKSAGRQDSVLDEGKY